MLRRILSTALSLALALSVSAAGYGYAAGADHCWMMATHGHHMHAAAEHCDPAAGMAEHSHHHAMQDGSAPSSTIASEMPACQCCLGPATSILQPSINGSLANGIAPSSSRINFHDAPLQASFEQSSSAPRAPPAYLL